MQIGIIGNGYVGGATALLGNGETIKTLVYDREPEKSIPSGLRFEDLSSCDFIFVCVPTPMHEDGSADIHLVEEVVKRLAWMDYDREKIIVKSTVPVGTCRKLGVMFMPEFLTEKNWKEDFLSQENWIFGTNSEDDDARDKLRSLFALAFAAGSLNNPPQTFFCTTEEAEMSKYVRNCFLATKVSFFNEIREFCDGKENTDFEKVRQLTVLDSRIGDNHTLVPGPDGKGGFGGTCFPKDMASMVFQMQAEDTAGYVMQAALFRNHHVDRPEKDWENDRGRAVV